MDLVLFYLNRTTYRLQYSVFLENLHEYAFNLGIPDLLQGSGLPHDFPY